MFFFYHIQQQCMISISPRTIMDPPRKWSCLKDVFPLQRGDFQVPDISFFRDVKYIIQDNQTTLGFSASSSYIFFPAGGV